MKWLLVLLLLCGCQKALTRDEDVVRGHILRGWGPDVRFIKWGPHATADELADVIDPSRLSYKTNYLRVIFAVPKVRGEDVYDFIYFVNKGRLSDGVCVANAHGDNWCKMDFTLPPD